MMLMNFLNQSDEEKTKAVVYLQRLRTPRRDSVARFFTKLSDEEFIVLFIILLFWGPLCDTVLAWHICSAISYSFTIGNIIKNKACKRRPMSPPAWADYTSTEEYEFAMPSTHALNSVAMGVVVSLHFLLKHNHKDSLLLLLFWAIFPVIWSLPISVSRVYLGAHSFPDIVAGWGLGFVYGGIIYVFSEYLNYSNPITLIIGVSVVFGVMLYHPIDKSSILNFHLSEGTFDYTPTLLGVALGSTTARYINPTEPTCSPELSTKIIFRFLIFGPFLGLIYYITRKFTPIIIEFSLKKMGIQSHYIPYSKYKEYVVNAVRNSISNDNDNNTNGEHHNGNSNGHSNNNHNNNNGHDNNNNNHNNGHNTHTNQQLLLCYPRLWGKLFLYTAITWTVTLVVPFSCSKMGFC